MATDKKRKPRKQHINVFTGVDMQGDACLYLTRGQGRYLSLDQLESLKDDVEAFVNGDVYKNIVEAARKVFEWDDLHGYGADDDGYNRLAMLRSAIDEAEREAR